MILNETKKDVAVCGEFEQTGFSVQADAASFDILSNKVYTHKVRAVIRELCCNALDSHVDAGNDEPFKVHLPTTLEPWFSVQDFGLGLSHRDCMDLYTTYFKSTKRDSNKTVGCLGIGSKSFYCLVDSATITSVHNGMKGVYSAYKDEKNLPQMACLSLTETDEHNGVEISMSVHGKNQEFYKEAINVLKYFSRLPDINTPNIVKTIEEENKDYLLVHEDYCLTTGYDGVYAVMGNVAYRIPAGWGITSEGYQNVSGFVRFPLGSLEFEAGRENLSMSDNTQKALESRMATVKEEAKALLQEELDSTTCQFERANKVEKNAAFYNCFGVSFKHARLNKPTDPYKVLYVDKYSRNNTVRSETSFSVKHPVGTGVEFYNPKPRFQSRIKQYLKENECGIKRVVLITDIQADEMGVPRNLIKGLDSLPKVKREPSANGRSDYHSTFTFKKNYHYSEDRNKWDKATLDLQDKTTEIVYVEINRWVPVKLYGLETKIKNAERLGINVPEVYGFKTVFLKTKGFKNINAIKLMDYLEREIANVTVPDTIYTVDRCEGEIRGLIQLADKCTEPLLTKLKETYALTQRGRNDLISECGIIQKVDNSCDTLYDKLMEKYPMLEILNRWSYDSDKKKETVINYINKGV